MSPLQGRVTSTPGSKQKGIGKFADKPGSVEQSGTGRIIGQSFLWATRYREALAAYPGATRATPLLPYLALPRMGFTVPVLSPVLRWALTPPFHPYLIFLAKAIGGLLSVALSVASRRPAVSRHPALRGPDFPPHTLRCTATAWRTSRADYT